ncbi:hypothetical protein D3C81_484690 [compost metagenome]
MILCRVVGHAWKEGTVIRRTNEVRGDWRVVFCLMTCQRCGQLCEAARLEIDRFQFPNGVMDYLDAHFRKAKS